MVQLFRRLRSRTFQKALSELAVVCPVPGSFVEAYDRGNGVSIAFEEAAPAEVVLEIFGGPVEAAYPCFQAAVAGIDVLDVEDSLHHSNALLYIDRTMCDPGRAGEGLIDVGTIRAEDSVRIDK